MWKTPWAPSRRQWKRLALLTGGGVLASVLIVVWFARDGLLMAAAIDAAAREAYPDGVGAVPGPMYLDHVLALQQFPPRRLAKFLNAPFVPWRATVAQALAAFDERRCTADAWNGVASALVHSANTDSSVVVRTLARQALAYLPSLPTDEGEKLLASAVAPMDWMVKTAMLDVIARHCPTLRLRLRSVLLKFAAARDEEQRIVALCVWSTRFPEDPDAAVEMLIEQASGDGFLNEKRLCLRTLLETRPRLLGTLMERGGASAQLALYELRVCEDCRYWRAGEAAALELLLKPDVDAVRAALRFLSSHPDGCSLLLQRLRAASERQRESILQWIVYFDLPANARLAAADGDLLVSLLFDAADKAAATRVLRSWQFRTEPQPFTAGSGLLNPRFESTLRPLLSSVDENGRWLAAHFLTLNKLLTEDDLTELAQLVGAHLQDGRPYERANLLAIEKLLSAICSRFPRRLEFAGFQARVRAMRK